MKLFYFFPYYLLLQVQYSLTDAFASHRTTPKLPELLHQLGQPHPAPLAPKLGHTCRSRAASCDEMSTYPDVTGQASSGQAGHGSVNHSIAGRGIRAGHCITGAADAEQSPLWTSPCGTPYAARPGANNNTGFAQQSMVCITITAVTCCYARSPVFRCLFGYLHLYLHLPVHLNFADSWRCFFFFVL